MGLLQSCMNDEPKTPERQHSFVRLLPKTFSPRKVAASPKERDSSCVGKRSGSGSVAMRRVACWAGSVVPARADMDRFAVCSRERICGDADGTGTGPRLVCGVFDGHGVRGASNWGRDVADEACGIVSEAAFETAFGSVLSPGEQLTRLFHKFQERHERRYDDTVARDMAAQWEAFEHEHGFAPPRLLPPEGGSTATVALVEGDALTVAWVGDSRAVLATRRAPGAALEAVALTNDHNAAASTAECARLEAAGATVAGLYVGVDGAEGLLQVTRSLGDRAHHAGKALLATPEVRSRDLAPGDAFLIVASDGLWHVRDDAAAAAFVDDRLRAAPSEADSRADAALAAATALAEDARKAAQASPRVADDDVTVLVVVFQAP